MWNLQSDGLGAIAFVTSAVVAAVGLIALLCVWLGWRSIAPSYRELPAKLGVAFFRFVAAASAVASKSAAVAPGTPLQDQPWVLTTLLAAGGYLLWEFTGAIGDHKHKAGKEKAAEFHEQEVETLKQDRDDALEQNYRLGHIVSHLRTLVSEKFQRIRRVLLASTVSRVSAAETRAALAPVDQISMILEKLASLFHLASGRPNQNFRVGLYAEDEGRLVPIGAFDLDTRRRDPFTSYQQHADRFRLDNDVDPSHAVRAVREGKTLIVPGCANHPVFRYFHERQPNYLKSLVAHPLFDFSPDGATPVRAALLIDTDVAGFFQEEDEEMIRVCLNEFASRLALEYAIHGLIG